MSKSLTSYFPRHAINLAVEGTQTFSGGNGKCIFLFGLALLPETEGWATAVVYTYRLSVNTAGWCVLPLVFFFLGTQQWQKYINYVDTAGKRKLRGIELFTVADVYGTLRKLHPKWKGKKNECWEKPQKCTCISNVLAFFPSFRGPPEVGTTAGYSLSLLQG